MRHDMDRPRSITERVRALLWRGGAIYCTKHSHNKAFGGKLDATTSCRECKLAQERLRRHHEWLKAQGMITA